MKIELTKEITDFIYQLAVVGAQTNAQQVQTAVETFQKAAIAAAEADQTGEPVVDPLTEFVPVDGTA